MTIGIDGSYFAMYNYWFAFDRNIIQEIAYPLGVLGFLFGPSTYGINLEIGIIFIILSRIFVAFFLLSLFRENKKNILIAIPITLYNTYNTLFALFI